MKAIHMMTRSWNRLLCHHEKFVNSDHGKGVWLNETLLKNKHAYLLFVKIYKVDGSGRPESKTYSNFMKMEIFQAAAFRDSPFILCFEVGSPVFEVLRQIYGSESLPCLFLAYDGLTTEDQGVPFYLIRCSLLLVHQVLRTWLWEPLWLFYTGLTTIYSNVQEHAFPVHD